MKRLFVHNAIGGHFAYEIGESANSCGLLTDIEHKKGVDGMQKFPIRKFQSGKGN